MSKFPPNPMVVSVFLGLVTTGAAQSIEPVKPEAQLRVVIFNYAEVPDDTLAQAQAFAEEVFQHAGLGIEWSEPLSAATRHSGKALIGRPRFVMRIVPNSMIGGWANNHDLLGFSLVPANREMGSIAGAYHERIEGLSRRLGGKPALVLGYVIAHELGHLLLGAYSHSHSGIMSYPFERKDFLLASQGRLQFTPYQAKRIRKRFQKRVRSVGASRLMISDPTVAHRYR